MVAADQRRIAPFTSCTTRRARPAWRCIRRCWRSVSATSCAGTIRMPARSRSPTACASTRTAPFRRRSSLAGRSANARRCRCCVPNATPQPGWRRRPATRLQWMVHLGDTLQPAFRKRLCPQDFAPAGQGRPAHSLACASTPFDRHLAAHRPYVTATVPESPTSTRRCRYAGRATCPGRRPNGPLWRRSHAGSWCGRAGARRTGSRD